MLPATCRHDTAAARLLDRLKYIADSPPRKHGGFHENAIQTAKDAITHIKNLRALIERLEGVKTWPEGK